MNFQDIEEAVRQKERISVEQARWLWINANNEELCLLANLVRDRFHEPLTATYLLMRIINYTNV